jgi:RNA polymerase sigma-70 factor, ECF subfamily
LTDRELDFVVFYKSNFQRIVLFAALTCGNEVDAEDAAQEAFASAFRRWSTLSADGRDQLRYVLKAAHNQALNVHRRRKRLGRLMDKLGPDRSGGFVHVEEEAMRDVAVRAMMRLPRQQRALAVLCWLEEMPVPEAADILGISVKTARTHLARARAKLVSELGQIGNQGDGRGRDEQ